VARSRWPRCEDRCNAVCRDGNRRRETRTRISGIWTRANGRSDKGIHSSITEPDIVIVLDPTLLENPDITEGIPNDGILIVNTSKLPAEIRKELHLDHGKVYTVNGTQIALDTLGKAIPNTVMLGALIRISNVFDLATMERNIVKKFTKKYNERIADMNVRAIRRAYEEVQGE
jgi:pyruvate ferredoxin oxidoreductase gamma subunit